MSKIFKNQMATPIKINNFEINIKNKIYKIALKLNRKYEYIKICVSEKSIKRDFIKYFTFNCINHIDSYYFAPFKCDITKLYKFLVRIFNTNLVDINKFDNNTLVLHLICLKNKQLCNFPIIISSDTAIIKKEKEDLKKDISKKENSFDTEPFSYDTVFDYKTQNKTYKINLRMEPYKYYDKNYNEIIFIIRDDTNINETYMSYFDLTNFLKLDINYYNLFFCTIDDIVDDFLIIINNNNYDLIISDKNIKFVYNIYNFGNNNDLFCLKSLDIIKFIKNRTFNEIDMKINDYYIKMNNIIQEEEEYENNILMEKQKPKENDNNSKIKNEFVIEIKLMLFLQILYL